VVGRDGDWSVLGLYNITVVFMIIIGVQNNEMYSVSEPKKDIG
jgi:hypothetical protein